MHGGTHAKIRPGFNGGRIQKDIEETPEDLPGMEMAADDHTPVEETI